jgi:hypothetical protein
MRSSFGRFPSGSKKPPQRRDTFFQRGEFLSEFRQVQHKKLPSSTFEKISVTVANESASLNPVCFKHQDSWSEGL